MFFEVVLGWVVLGLFAYFFAMLGMDRIYGEYQQDLLTLEKKIKNPRSCPLCKQSLTTWFSQCVSCRLCDLRTCRSCAVYNLTVGEWTCQKCVHEQNNIGSSFDDDGMSRCWSRYWYDDLLSRQASLAEFSVPVDTQVDRTTAARYAQLERFISRHLNISIEKLNSTDVGKVYKGSKYDLLFARYHEVLSAELSDLLRYLKSADQVKEAVSLKKLKEFMDKIRVAAKMDLGLLKPNTERHTRTETDRAFTPTYPDILSTAILNRIIIDEQEKSQKCSVSPVSNDSAVVADYSSTSTELPESGSEKDTRNWVLASSNGEVNPPIRTSDDESFIDTPGGGSLGSNWSHENVSNPHLKIEESIEEVTTTTYESDESSAGTTSSQSDNEVEFDEEISSRKAIERNVANWEHNWLFKRKKDVLKKRQKLYQEPVTMLVPNPAESVEVMIGDAKVSDLEDEFETLDVSELGYVVVDAAELEQKVQAEVEKEIIEVAAPIPASHEVKIEAAVKVAVQVPRVSESPIRTPESESETFFLESEVKETEPVKPEKVVGVAVIEVAVVEGAPLEVSKESFHETNHPFMKTENPADKEADRKKEDDSSSSSESESEPKFPPMRIAEREKEKWNHPVSVKYNPYAAENLSKRLNEKYLIPLPSVKSRDESEDTVENDFPIEKGSLDKFRRDYYVHSMNKSDDRKNSSSSSSSSSSDGDFQKIKLEPIVHIQPEKVPASTPNPPKPADIPSNGIPDSGEDLHEIRLPSVRNLAKKFSSPMPEVKPIPVKEPPKTSWKPVTGITPIKQQIHSLTARSVSREFREGLRLSKPAITNFNIKIADNNF